MRDIDLVFPYLNNKDKVWINTYNKYCIDHNLTDRLNKINSSRFDDFNFLKYLFRAVDKYMPFINKIHLIVSNKEQVPEWIDTTKVNIVLHSDIIPEEYLPTFNSTTIEMFLDKITDLSEYFIYSNDDVFPVNTFTENDFFDGDKPRIKMNIVKPPYNVYIKQFDKVCKREFQKIAKALNISIDKIYRPEHEFTPLRLSYLSKVKELLKDAMHMTAFRDDKNLNQYIYPDYLYLTNNCVSSSRKFSYYKITEKDKIINELQNPSNDVICINDADVNNRSNVYEISKCIVDCFAKVLPNKCKYEL